MLSDEQWRILEPLLDLCRPRGKTPPHDMRLTVEAILWRHQHDANWRATPDCYAPWWRAAQTFNRWSKQDVWARTLDLLTTQFERQGWPVPPYDQTGDDPGGARKDELRTTAQHVRRLTRMLLDRPKAGEPPGDAPPPAIGAAQVATVPESEAAGTGIGTIDDAIQSLLVRAEMAILTAASLQLQSAALALEGQQLAAEYHRRLTALGHGLTGAAERPETDPPPRS